MIIAKAINPLIPNLITITSKEIQGITRRNISANLKMVTFCSVTKGSKASKIINPIPEGEMFIPVLVAIARNNPLANAGMNNA